MHKVRAAARRHAWYDDGEGNYNPFAKHGISHTTSRSSVDAGDLESGRPQYARGTSEGAYRSQRNSQRQFNPPDRTLSEQQRLPPVSSGSGSPRSLNFEPGHKHHDDGESKQEPDTAHTESTDTSNTLTTERPQDLAHTPTAKSTESVPRRRFGGLIGGAFKHKEAKGKDNEKVTETDNGNDLYRIDTNGKKKMIEPKFTWQSQVRNTLFNSPINILLIAVPVGIVIGALKNPDGSYVVNGNAVFAVNFIAIVPLAAMLSYATEEVALRTGETIGGLLNASFGNATELIVSIIALFKDEIVITQTSLIGSMLSNLLLVLGMCFFFGGLTRIKQKFNIVVAQTASSLLTLALAGVIIPTIFDVSTQNSNVNSDSITRISRGVSVLLLVVYGAYLFFQLHTHADIYNAESEKQPKRGIAKGDANKGIAQMGGVAGMIAPAAQEESMPDEDDGPEQPKLNFWVALCTLLVATALIAANSEFMVDAINYVAEDGTISKSFLGLILIPIVGNAAEHATAVTVACKDKMDLAIGVAVGSSLQIAALVLPLVVIIGWIADKPDMTLDFDVFQVVVLFVSVLLVQSLIGDGESHWLEGAMLFLLYVAIASAAWFYPTDCVGDLCPSPTMTNSTTG